MVRLGATAQMIDFRIADQRAPAFHRRRLASNKGV
jgi:hypothetical protein